MAGMKIQAMSRGCDVFRARLSLLREEVRLAMARFETRPPFSNLWHALLQHLLDVWNARSRSRQVWSARLQKGLAAKLDGRG
jgi:hypothetical protein